MRYIITLTLACLLLLSACSSTQTKKVGVILPLSGQYTFLGQGIKNAIEMNNLSGLTVIYEDDACDVTKGLTAGTKLIEVDKVDALITTCTATAKALYNLTSSQDLPHISLTETYIYNKDNLFQMMPPSGQLFAKLGEVARKYQSVAIIYTTEEVNEGEFGNVESIKKGLGTGTRVVEMGVIPGTKDFRTEILKMEQAKPDVVISIMFKGDHLTFLKQYEEMGVDIPLLGGPFYELDLEGLKGGLPAKDLFNNTISTNFESMKTPEFEKAYALRYNSTSPMFSEYGYDAIGMMSAALKQADPLTALSELEYSGAEGKIHFDQLGNIAGKVVVKKYDGEKYAVSG